MHADQAVFTSLSRRGRSGYHVVARSPGVTEAEASALASWSPSHGSLIVDVENAVSVNFHPLPGGRYALSRTCEGPPEYSGRGGRQLYTHALVLDEAALRAASCQAVAIYRAAMALGAFVYRADPPALLDPLELPRSFARPATAAWDRRAAALGLPPLDALRDDLIGGRSLRPGHDGDRLAFVECLLGPLAPDESLAVSFATSLLPSAARPCRLAVVGDAVAGDQPRATRSR
ncbi:MAG TPA: hypothetical protein VG406_14670 [Isosphaeraceae bacterium]|jgi:hypothetical protein|nr:hypothetical protein [Isosphaeraceae bacterium]